jgi:hypothetical protein
MVQAQAAIIAIVITLTLIAVQLTASAYSPRVIRIFKNNPDMWLLLGFYGLSMLYGLVVLKMVVGGVRESVSQDVFWSLGCVSISFESCVSFAYGLEAFTLVALFPYMLNIIGLLKPENIIKRLAIEITKDKILNPKKDPIQPIMDIIHGAVMKYDIATVGCGLDAVTEKAVIDLYKDLDNENVSAHFCGHLGRAGRYAVHAGEQESAIEIIGCLKDIGTLTIEKRYDKAAKTVAPYIEMIGTFAAEKRLIFVTCDATESLKDVGILAAENQLKDVTVQSIDSLGNVGMYAADNKIGIAAQDAAKYLGRVGKYAAENELENAAKQAADSLGVVGNYAAENKLKYATSEAARSLGDVGKAAAEKGLEDATDQAARSLGDVGKTAERNGLERAVGQALESLGQVGKNAAESGLGHAAEYAAMDLVFFGRFVIEKGNKETAKRAIYFLEKIGTIAAEKGEEFEPVAWQAAESLGLVGSDAAAKRKEFEEVTNEVICRLSSVGRYTEGTGLEKATKQVAQSFVWIGVLATDNGLDGAAQEAVKSLAAISNKELVAQAIHESESGLRAYGDSFQKFMDLCEQQLKKPHPRNSN